MMDLLSISCAVCGGAATEASKDAFAATTVLMSAVPLASMGALAYYLVNRVRRQNPPDEGE